MALRKYSLGFLTLGCSVARWARCDTRVRSREVSRWPMKILAGVVTLLTWYAIASLAQAQDPINPATSPRQVPMNPAERANLRWVLDWWRQVIEAGHLELAPKYQAESYIQHNPNISTGRAGFLAAFGEENSPVNPIPEQLKNPPRIAGARGDYVWMMFARRREATAATPEYIQYHFDLLRLQGGQLQEHWDANRKRPGSGAVVHGVSPKPPAQFATGNLTAAERETRSIAIKVASQIYLEGRTELAADLMSADYIEHNPNMQRKGNVQDRLRAFEPPQTLRSVEPTLALVNGEYVLMMWDLTAPDPDDGTRQYPWNYFQLVRVRDGKVVEHWDQDAPRGT